MRETDLERLASLLGAESVDAPGSPAPRAAALLDPSRLAESLAGLQDVEGEFLALIGRLGGEVGPGSADGWLRRRGVADPDAFVERLRAEGLLFHLPAGGPNRSAVEAPSDARGLRIAGRLWVPEAIGRLALERHPLASLSPLPEPSQSTRPQPWEIVRRLFLKRRSDADRGSRPTEAPAALRRARSARGAGEQRSGPGGSTGHRADTEPDPYLTWLEALAAELAPAQDLFERPPVAQRRALLEAAVGQTAWGELDEAPGILLETPSAAGLGRSDIPSAGSRVRARRHLLRTLAATAAPERWHSLAELAERAIDAAPDFLIRRRHARGEARAPRNGVDAPASPVAYRGIRRITPAGPAPLSMVEDWRSVEGAFVAGFVRGPLHWLGLVDLAGPADATLFRLTPLGAAVLDPQDGADPPTGEEPRPPGRFFVQPNFEIMADGGGDNIAAIVRLCRVAQLESLDRAALLRVTRESVLRALDSGLSHREILALLSDAGRVTVPQNVEYSVGEWVAAHDRYELRTEVCVLEADDPAELDDLMAALPDCLERLGPTAARVRPGRLPGLEAALAQRADVAHIDHAQGLARVFHLDEKMGVTPLPDRWHWYPEHLLEQIGERLTAGGRRPRFRLTAETVGRGLARGLSAEEIERFVEACADGALTARQRLLLRGWLGRYGPVQLAPAILLALPPDAASDALALPELREQIAGWLSPAVFLIRPAGRLKVKRLLEAAGLEIGDQLAAPAPDGRPLPPEDAPRRPATWGRQAWALGDGEPERLALVEEAIARELTLEIGYASVVKGDPPGRWEITPRRLERSRWGRVRVQAYCHARQTERAFDLDRVTEVRILGSHL